jgi:hypothetical protein
MQVTRIALGWPVLGLMHRRRITGNRITYVRLDVHKDGIVAAIADGGLRGEVRGYGRIANTAAASLLSPAHQFRAKPDAAALQYVRRRQIKSALKHSHWGASIAELQRDADFALISKSSNTPLL